MLLILTVGLGRAPAQLETRVYSYTNSPPRVVERQIRALVPEKPRVSMNPEAGQVLVIAEPSVHEKIASMLHRMDRPPARLYFRVRHNREVKRFSVMDGVPLTLPVSGDPPEDVVARARGRLSPGREKAPAAGTALKVHVKLLREDPPAVRLRIVPAVAFGKEPPYEVVSYDELATDLMLTTENYVDVREALGGHDFYRDFLRTRPTPATPPRPVGLLMSFERLGYGQEGEASEESQEEMEE